jgi:SnoaL-like domain
MIDKKKLEQAARTWMNDWNNRSIQNLMSHYADDVIFYSHTVTKRWGIPSGKLEGKGAVEKHFRKGMELVPEIHFEFHSLLFGLESIILLYKRETGVLAADYVLFNDEGMVKEVRTHLTGNEMNSGSNL